MARKRYNKGKRVDMRQGGRVALAKGNLPEAEDLLVKTPKNIRKERPPMISIGPDDRPVNMPIDVVDPRPIPTTPAPIMTDPTPVQQPRPQATSISQPQPQAEQPAVGAMIMDDGLVVGAQTASKVLTTLFTNEDEDTENPLVQGEKQSQADTQSKNT